MAKIVTVATQHEQYTDDGADVMLYREISNKCSDYNNRTVTSAANRAFATRAAVVTPATNVVRTRLVEMWCQIVEI